MSNVTEWKPRYVPHVAMRNVYNKDYIVWHEQRFFSWCFWCTYNDNNQCVPNRHLSLYTVPINRSWYILYLKVMQRLILGPFCLFKDQMYIRFRLKHGPNGCVPLMGSLNYCWMFPFSYTLSHSQCTYRSIGGQNEYPFKQCTSNFGHLVHIGQYSIHIHILIDGIRSVNFNYNLTHKFVMKALLLLLLLWLFFFLGKILDNITKDKLTFCGWFFSVCVWKRWWNETNSLISNVIL